MPFTVRSPRLGFGRRHRLISQHPVALTSLAALLVLTVAASTLVFVRAHAAVYSRSPHVPIAVYIKPMAPAFSGTRTVGPTGDYLSLTAAIADIQAQGLDGALTLELLPTYLSAAETFPLTFTNLTGASAVNTLTVRPASGASGLAITSADAVATVSFDNGSFVTFDGRAGGAETTKDLTIENTNTAGAALRFINEASGNTVKYVALKGVNTSATGGVVLFGTTTGAGGNDNNTIDNCDIGDGATTPTNGIYSAGTTATTAQNNSGNTVSNCNIFNFYAATAIDSAGVRLDGGNTDWTVTGNSFYQTASRAAVGASVRGIYVNDTAGNNFAITNNSIGGSQASAGGTAWTTTGTTVAYLFVGIQLNVGHDDDEQRAGQHHQKLRLDFQQQRHHAARCVGRDLCAGGRGEHWHDDGQHDWQRHWHRVGIRDLRQRRRNFRHRRGGNRHANHFQQHHRLDHLAGHNRQQLRFVSRHSGHRRNKHDFQQHRRQHDHRQ